MKRILVPLGAALGLAVLFAGCESTGRTARIQEKSAVYASLTADQKKAIDDGVLQLGFTSDMVYLALGNPDKVKSKDTTEGRVEMWTYTNYYPTVSATTTSYNNPGARYNMMTTSANAPGGPTSGRAATPSFGATGGGPSPTMNVADLPAHTLYVFLLNGKVFNVKIDNQY
jgi:hypothetical protein